ncbi:MAG: sulfate adenylyltransferase subunit 1 [Hyphomicrobiaceae bacterium]
MSASIAVKSAGSESAADNVLRHARPAYPYELSGIVHILTCGSVDDGKSTLIGRLLWDASDLPDDTRASLLASAGPAGVPDLSLLVDGLVAEREQGITIDIAWRYFDARSRRHVIIDSPGHEQYTRNMASGASHADIAIMLVDARHGVKRQTRRHAAILELVGLRRVILAVNKMDLVDWSEQRFQDIEAEFRKLAARFRFDDAVAIPVAAKAGDNVARKSDSMPWYTGPTLIEQLSTATGRHQKHSGKFRMPVQMVLRDGGDFRGIAGTVSSGRITVGAPLQDALTGQQAAVRRIVSMDRERLTAQAGEAIVIELDRDLDIARGTVLVDPVDPPRLSLQLTARLVWLADVPLSRSSGVLLQTATDTVPVSGLEMNRLLDLDTMAEIASHDCAANDIALARITLARHAVLEPFEAHDELGSFVLVDALSGSTLAGGVVLASSEARDDHESQASVFRLTAEMLAGGVCAGLSSDSAEFRRRSEHVAMILAAAGVRVEIDDG